MSFFESLSVNTLDAFSFIAGTEQVLTFDVYDSGFPVNLVSSTCTWALSPFGRPNDITLTKNGVLSGTPANEFKITLLTTDSLALAGKYIHQPIVRVLSGSVYRVGQGVITIVPAID